MKKFPAFTDGALLNISEGECVLVAAPHLDDETIGCGELFLKYGKQTDVLLLANGCGGYNRTDAKARAEDTIGIRRGEFRQIMEMSEVNRFTALDISDGDIYVSYDKVRRYDIKEYDYIFVTSRFEQSQDHQYAWRFLKKMCREQRARAALIEYEVWSPFREPNLILGIDDVADEKMRMVSFYKSQLECYDYVNFARGLSLYRDARFRKKNAEAYFMQPRHYYLKIAVRALTSYRMRQAVKNALCSLKRRFSRR